MFTNGTVTSKNRMELFGFFFILLTGGFDISFSTFYYVNETKTWQEAQSYCRANYIDLATIDSIEQVNETVNIVDPGYNGAAWIGLKRTWAWSTGDSFNNSLASWGAYQPNEGNKEAACLLFEPNNWNDYFCSNSFSFFCYDDSPTASNKFIRISSSKTWGDARTYCRQYYTDLAFTNSTEDTATLNAFSAWGWIGLISSQWSDGSFSSFRYWASGNSETSLVNKCTAMVAANFGKWIGTGCDLKLPFICYGDLQLFTRQYHSVDYPRTWPSAQRYCRAMFTDLATIDTINDVNTLMNQVAVGYKGSIWIGLQRITHNLVSWSQGEEVQSNYSNWDAGRPNGSGQCVVNINNVWRDYNCSETLYFVCYHEGMGFIMVQSNKTWKDAQTYCQSYYTDLATIHSPWEQNKLIELVGRGVFVWIGFFLDTWQWSDQWGHLFKNWASGQPSSTSGNCTAMDTNDSGKWTIQNCNVALPFFCYGEESTMRRQNTIRIKISYSGTTNLNDVSMQAAILKEIEKKYSDWSMANDFKVRWIVKSDGNVFVKSH